MNEAIKLSLFCRKSGTVTRGDVLEKPWVKDGYEYVSNGRILIRIKTDKPDTEGRHPNAKDLFEQQKEIPPVEIKLPDRIVDQACDDCFGSGIRHCKCESCDGKGSHRCECGDTHGCRDCDSSGNIELSGKCPACDGTGWGYKHLQIHGLKLHGFYIAMIVKNLPEPKAIAINESSMSFTFLGGEGLLCSLKEKSA